MQDTEYTRSAMEETVATINGYIDEYSNLLQSLAANIEKVGQNWVEGDPTAAALYQSLKNEYNGFKATLDEMNNYMNTMRGNIETQIQNYSAAENKIAGLF